MPKKINLTNKTFGEWSVIREASKEEKQYRPGAYWLCKCSCGTLKIINGQTLRNGESKSCGCKTQQLISEKNINKAENLSNKKYGKLLVLSRDLEMEKQHPQRGSTYWKCQCDCGKQISVLRSSLITGKTQSCGCLRQEISKKHMINLASNNFIDETGNKYGKLTVIKKIKIDSKQGAFWLCQCECGNETIVSGNSLRTGNTSSCGCLKTSKGELKIKQYLDNNNLLYVKEYPVLIENKKLRFDFAILNNNTVEYFIEFDGKQHSIPCEYFGGEEQFNITQQNDELKNQYAKKHNIPLIRIPYWHYNKLNIKDLLLDTSSFINQ